MNERKKPLPNARQNRLETSFAMMSSGESSKHSATRRLFKPEHHCNMSWQTYVDDHLLCDLPNGGQLSHAAIVGLDGGVWAQDDSFPSISAQEVDKISKGFDDQSTLAQKGLTIGGTKYMVVAGEEGAVIRGRKTPAGGVTIKKTVSAMVIGIYAEGAQPGDVNMVVENLGDYLVGQGI